MPMMMMDAPAALSFVLSQRTSLERDVLLRPYPQFKYAERVFVDRTANPWAASVTFFTRDMVGRAKFVNGSGDDIPYANVTRSKFEETIRTAGIGAKWSLEEIGAAQMHGVNLSTEELDAARMAYELLVDDVVHTGDTGLGVEGLFNTTGITTTAAGTAWSAATSAAIVAQVVALFDGVRTATLGTEIADTLLLPLSAHTLIATRAYGVEGGITILEFLEKSLQAMLGFVPMIQADYRLTRAVVYKRTPDAVKLHMPMPLTFLAPQYENFQVKTLGMFRFSALNIRKPQTMRYLTGV
jgi:hypothetical protein